MNSVNSKKNQFHEGQSVAVPAGQVAFLFLLLGIGYPIILATIEHSSFSAVILLSFDSVVGLMLCRRTQVQLRDPSLSILGYLWLAKLGATLFLLYVGWIPELDPALTSRWGYDPQRYFFQANELVANNWSTDFISLNYTGILYYYGAIFYAFGHNPVIPALINAFITLIATLYLVKVGYEIKGQRDRRDWILAFALLLPEMLWYDVMTSRETLMAVLLLFAMLTSGRYLARTASISLFDVLISVGLTMIIIASVRVSMLLPVVISISLMVLLIQTKRELRFSQRILLTTGAGVALMTGPVINAYIGGYDFHIDRAFHTVAPSAEYLFQISGKDWSQNSIGMLLIPNGTLQSILFLPLRMILYLVSPLPNVIISASDLMSGSWAAWQKLLTMVAAVINVFLIPYVLASLVQSIKLRKTNPAPLLLHISYWVTFASIAGGSLIIHARYRVMALLLLWGCAWLGVRTCPKNLIYRTTLLWYGLLACGALFYIAYKSGGIA